MARTMRYLIGAVGLLLPIIGCSKMDEVGVVRAASEGSGSSSYSVPTSSTPTGDPPECNSVACGFITDGDGNITMLEADCEINNGQNQCVTWEDEAYKLLVKECLENTSPLPPEDFEGIGWINEEGCGWCAHNSVEDLCMCENDPCW